MYPTKYSTKEGTNDSTKGSTKEVQTTVQSADIVKLKQKTKTKKSVSNDTPEKCAQNSVGVIPQDILEQYITSMEVLGKPMTPSGLEMLFKRLEQLAPGDKESQTAIMEQTIRNGWKDVYPLKRNGERREKEKTNRFHNFEQRNTDYNAIVLEKLNERLRAKHEEEG